MQSGLFFFHYLCLSASKRRLDTLDKSLLVTARKISIAIQSNCFAAWNYGRDVGEAINLDLWMPFYVHFLVNCIDMYYELLMFFSPPTGDLVAHGATENQNAMIGPCYNKMPYKTL